MATSSERRHRAAAAAAATVLLCLAAFALLVARGESSSVRARPAAGARSGAVSTPPLRWPRPAAPPAGWPGATIASGQATVYYPPTWKLVAGDPGTVSAALRDSAGVYHGYLNVTPSEGAERLAGYASFRLARNRDEGDTDVRELLAGEGIHFRAARGSCVFDDYVTAVGSHAYRELACLVAGASSTGVFVGATLRSDWRELGPTIERAASAFLER